VFVMFLLSLCCVFVGSVGWLAGWLCGCMFVCVFACLCVCLFVCQLKRTTIQKYQSHGDTGCKERCSGL